jgi:phosphoenolpyruvate synthase/pyruvate phosphate dikinase
VTRVLDLGDPRASDTALAGRKMATLATLKAAALPVPPAFVLTTEAGALEDPEVESAVLRAYDRLGRDVPVSVRSSADTEDGTRQSAAGMYGTVLDVVGGDALLAALATCRASAELSHVRAPRPGPRWRWRSG